MSICEATTEGNALQKDPLVSVSDKAALTLALNAAEVARNNLNAYIDHMRRVVVDLCATRDNGRPTAESIAHKFKDEHYSKVTSGARMAAYNEAWSNLNQAIERAKAGKAEHLNAIRSQH